MELIFTLLAITLPEQFINIMWGTSLYGYRFQKVKGKILLSSFIVALTSELLWYSNVHSGVRIFITLLIGYLSIKYILEETWLRSFIIILTSYLSSLVLEVVSVLTLLQFINLQEVMDNVYIKFIVVFIYSLPLLIGTLVVHFKDFSFKKNPISNRDKHNWFFLLVISLLSLFQVFLIIFQSYTIYIKYLPSKNINLFNLAEVPLIAILLIVINIIVIALVIKNKNYNQNKEIEKYQDNYHDNLRKLIVTLKGERHDYINEIQTIYSMSQMNKCDKLKDYLAHLVGNIQAVNQSIQIKNIPVNAMLYSKLADFQTNGVNLKINTDTEDTFESIKEYDLVKIISNLLDNALRAVTEAQIKEPFVTLDWLKDQNNNAIISVHNNGPKIEDKYIDKIFDEGFSTKKSNNNGYGLPIIKLVIEEKYKGNIEVISNDKYTSFTITIPL